VNTGILVWFFGARVFRRMNRCFFAFAAPMINVARSLYSTTIAQLTSSGHRRATQLRRILSGTVGFDSQSTETRRTAEEQRDLIAFLDEAASCGGVQGPRVESSEFARSRTASILS